MAELRVLSRGALQPDMESALTDPDFYPHRVERVQVAETHISKVFLTGSFVYKVKKPVDFGFLDFSTLEKRRYFCEQEVVLNQRLTRNVYLGVEPITREPAGYALNGTGEVVEYAVKMRQLPRERSMLALLTGGRLSPEMARELGFVLAGFYETARRGPDIDRLGSLGTIRINVEENFAQSEPFVPAILDPEKFEFLRQTLNTFMDRKSVLFARRVEDRRVCDCHGDLRLDHVYFMDSIQVIDCIEFNDRFRYGDVAGDLAFIALDMDYHGRSRLARTLLVSYALAADDPEVFTLLDFYKCYRAHVRCKIKCLQIGAGCLPYPRHLAAEEEAARWFDLAGGYARMLGRNTLWIIGGMIGSGKSTIAGELAKRLNVRVLSSDMVRKGLFGPGPLVPARAPFGEGIYTRSRTDETYAHMLLHAREDLARGRSIVLDATFGRARHRGQAVDLARELGVNLIFAECVCPVRVLRRRLAERRGHEEVSDARAKHLEEMQREFEPLEELGEEIYLRLDTDRTLSESLVELFCGTNLRQHLQAGISFEAPKSDPGP